MVDFRLSRKKRKAKYIEDCIQEPKKKVPLSRFVVQEGLCNLTFHRLDIVLKTMAKSAPKIVQLKDAAPSIAVSRRAPSLRPSMSPDSTEMAPRASKIATLILENALIYMKRF